jgi:hypothetical protein
LMTEVSVNVLSGITETNLFLIECSLGRYKELTLIVTPDNSWSSINLEGNMTLTIQIMECTEITSDNGVFRVLEMCVWHKISGYIDGAV